MANFNLDNYVPVHDRIEQFWELYPSGRVATEIVQHEPDGGFILMKASIFRSPDDAEPAATGHAFEIRGEGHVNKTSHIENCETSAVGRALANLGLDISKGVASREEMQKAERMGGDTNGGTQKTYPKAGKPATGTARDVKDIATGAQLSLLERKAREAGVALIDIAKKQFPDLAGVETISKPAASWLIDRVSAETVTIGKRYPGDPTG